jgi:predicted MPP superfamily phosphohydrolase
MNGHLTARDWLRERRRVITLLQPEPAASPTPNRDPAPASAAGWKTKLRAGRIRHTSRKLRRPPLTMLSLSEAEPGASRPPWLVDPEITQIDVWLSRLPAAFEGLKIVHLTDIHHSLFTPLEEVERVVHLANRLEPDIVALTGDYVTFSQAYIRPAARALGKLRARRGVFAVLGNHDFQVDADAVTHSLRANQIRVLRNAHHPIRIEKKTLWVVGIDDLWWNSDDLSAALRSVPAREPKILLCHNPLGIWEAAAHDIDLVLSGHTHGGQVRLPGFSSWYRSKLGERFVEGWNQLNKTQIYVSRGIGKVVVPIRVACPAEIAVLRLRRARPGSGKQ